MLAGWFSVRAVPPIPVKVGLVAPFSGPENRLGQQVLRATKLALSDRHRPGGDLRPVELVAYDDVGDADQVRRQAEKLVVDPQTVAVLGHPTLASALAAGPTYQAAQMPAWLFAPALPDGAVAAPIVPVGPSRATLAAAIRLWQARQGAQRILAVVTDSPDAAQMAEGLLPEGGLDAIRHHPQRPESAVAATLAERPDAVLYLGDAATGADYLEQLGTAGWSGPALLIPSRGTAHEALARLGPAGQNLSYLAPVPVLDTDPALDERLREATGLAAWPEAKLTYQLAAHLLAQLDAEPVGPTTRRWWDVSPAAPAEPTRPLMSPDGGLPKSGVGIFQSVPGRFPGLLMETIPPEP
jgi:ABC-type branched-subunit amino acid transport system substrate-binding protein